MREPDNSPLELTSSNPICNTGVEETLLEPIGPTLDLSFLYWLDEQ